ncbi:GNAT family N-acetyltransferase [Pontibacter silvestris]|uniref:GNAT family N-acetyltransferase n=1 Tax=Pontibacter silvestris TaxID=2305183 RepID=A0ABW4WVH0_9BACT|nr:GNAT family N-acetyltransferase [Pontibacter silvestris]MCC9137298.1 GNAT family N-acetyltransferase [Pontibacter silvestris]
MPDFRFAFLSEKDIPELHETFLNAFSDYFLPLQLDKEQFKIKIKRENIAPAFCAAAFHNGEMAGFILTGLGEWNGDQTAYNAGTGVKPAFRGNALTGRLYKFLLPKLQKAGVEQCLLEVLQQNKTAFKIYEHTGFRITRSLDSFRAKKQDLLLQVGPPEAITITVALQPDWQTYHSFWDIKPSWQNSLAAFKRNPDAKVVLEAHNAEQELVGYIAFLPKNGSVVHFAVDKKKRGKGVGTALLREAAELTEGAALMFINVDTAAKDFIFYLERCNFSRVLVQHEMLLPLV